MILRTSRERGFTLIEMLVVLVVLGLSAGLLLGRGPSRSPTLDARTAAGQIAQGLRLARSQAITRSRTEMFVLDLEQGAYRIGDGPPQALPRGLGLTLTAVAEHTAGSSLGGIAFLADGSSTGGRIGVLAGAAQLTVAVDWLTGRVSVADAN